ncbi:MAG: glycosyltransferase [Gemmatimonadales bacterium]
MRPDRDSPEPSLATVIPWRRLAVVGAWAPHRSEDAIVRAARRLGLTARPFDVLRQNRRFGALGRAWMERAIGQFDPDFMLCTRHAWLLGPERIARLLNGRVSAFWYFDAHEVPGVAELGRLCGAMYTTYANQREHYRALGVKTVRFLPQALDADLEKPAEQLRDEDRCEVSFVGSGQYPYRWPLLEQVARHFALQIRGPEWEDAPATLPVVGGAVYTSRLAEVIGGAAVSLGANSVAAQDDEHASASDRMWKVMACGGAYVGPYVPGIESLARDREHCRWFRTDDECIAIIRELLDQPQERVAMAARGRAHALANHSYDARLPLLLTGREQPLESASQTGT